MKKLQIAVGIIRNENNEIFITRRAADAPNRGLACRAVRPPGLCRAAAPAGYTLAGGISGRWAEA